MTLKTPSSVYVGARPSDFSMRAYSSGVSLCSRMTSGVIARSPGNALVAVIVHTLLVGLRAEVEGRRLRIRVVDDGPMRAAVVLFPGLNADAEMVRTLELAGAKVETVWHS